MPPSTLKPLLICFALVCCIAGCTEKEFDPNDTAGSFAIAKEPYDDENYEIAVTKLNEFKARFPYSRFAVEAELLVADSHFQLSNYIEASASYSQFAKLHPKHEKVPFALYRIGECHWLLAPDDIDREQNPTANAIAAWQLLIDEHPQSEHAAAAKKKMIVGRRRIAEAEEFVAKFYCKQEIWHACAFRGLKIAGNFPEYRDLVKSSTMLAAEAMQELAELKAELKADDPDSDANIFFKTMTAAQLKQKAQELKAKAAALAN